MFTRSVITLALVAAFLVFGSDRTAGPISAEMALPMFKATEATEVCLMPPVSYSAEQVGATRTSADQTGALGLPADWPGRDVVGGDIPPTRIVADPYPTFDGIAVDPENDVVVMSDENRSGLLIYDRKSGRASCRERVLRLV